MAMPKFNIPNCFVSVIWLAEEEQQRIEREEQERKAREEAEKQKIEVAERLKKEEKEREERRKRVEAIMSRTRVKTAAANNLASAVSNKVSVISCRGHIFFFFVAKAKFHFVSYYLFCRRRTTLEAMAWIVHRQQMHHQNRHRSMKCQPTIQKIPWVITRKV